MFLLSRLLYTVGKYDNQLEKIRKFRLVLSSGSHETDSTGPHIHTLRKKFSSTNKKFC